MGILDAITQNPGSFLEGYQDEEEKKQAARAAAAKRAAEMEDYKTKKIFEAGLTTTENLRREKVARKVATTAFGREQSNINLRHINSLAGEDRKGVREYVKELAKVGGIDEQTARFLVSRRIMSPASINILNMQNVAQSEKNLIDSVHSIDADGQKGTIQFIDANGVQGFVNRYKDVWSKTRMGKAGVDIKTYAVGMNKQIEKLTALKDKKKEKKEIDFSGGKEKIETKAGIAIITKQPKIDKNSIPSTFTTYMDQLVDDINRQIYRFDLKETYLGKRKGFNINNEQDREFIKNRLQKTVNVIAELKANAGDEEDNKFGKAHINKNLEKYLRKMPNGKRLADQLFGEGDVSPNITIGDGKAKEPAPPPPAPSSESAAQTQTAPPPSAVTTEAPASSAEPVVSTTGDDSIYVRTEPDLTATEPYEVHDFRKPIQHNYQVMNARYRDIGRNLSKRTNMQNLDSQEANTYFTNLKYLDDRGEINNQENYSLRKAYLTYKVSKRFQRYASSRSNPRERTAISRDSDFHNAIFNLQAMDPSFNGRAALAEAFFRTMPSGKVNPEDGSITKYNHGPSLFTNSKGDLTATGRQIEASIRTGQDMITALEDTIDLVEQGDKDGTVYVGVASDATQYLNSIKNNIRDFGIIIKSYTTGRRSEDESNTPANMKIMRDFEEKSREASRKLEANKGNMSKQQYANRAFLLSRKIRLSYRLSAALQGDGTGGGRTISDADFQFAIQAIWGSTGDDAKARLNDILHSTKGKLAMRDLEMQYDDTGLVGRLRTFFTDFNVNEQKYMRRAFIKTLDDGKDVSPNKVGSGGKINTRDVRELLNNRLVDYGQNTEMEDKGGALFVNSKEGRKRQYEMIGHIISAASNHTQMRNIAKEYTAARIADNNLSSDVFIRDYLRKPTSERPNENYEANATLRNLVNNSLFGFADHNEEVVRNPKSYLRIKDGKYVISTDTNLTPVNPFEFNIGYYHQINPEGIKNIYFDVLSFALEAASKTIKEGSI